MYQSTLGVLPNITELIPSSGKSASPIKEIVKNALPKDKQNKLATKRLTQAIDILILGPLLMYAGTGRTIPRPTSMLALLGMGTILINLADITEGL